MRFEPFDREGFHQFITSDEPLSSTWHLALGSGFSWMLVITGFVVGLAVGHALESDSAVERTPNALAFDVPPEEGRAAGDGIASSSANGPAANAASAGTVRASGSEAARPVAAVTRIQVETDEGALVNIAVASDPDGFEAILPAVTPADATPGERASSDGATPAARPSAAGEIRTVARVAPDVEWNAAVEIDSLPVHDEAAHVHDHARRATDDLTLVTRGELSRGETLGTALARHGISPTTVHVIASELRPVFDFRRSRPGDRYRLAQDADGRVLDFRYSQAPDETYHLAWDESGYEASKETADLHPQIAKIAGVVDSSFYGAILALGEQSALATQFARIFAWDIDFTRNVHPGDEFQILYERLYRRNVDGEEVYVRPGRVLAAHFRGQAGDYTIVYFEDEEGVGSYFRPDGSPVERSFLVAPLEFSRISSRFTRARQHPILNVTRPHPGIDYAAPAGTPVWAVAEGVVEYRARAGASGNLVRIRHAGGYTSHYAHLSRFAAGLEVGDRVEQKQLIGYVGSTGLSTGPHVCFRVKKNGRYVDPMQIKSPPGPSVERDQRVAFESVRDELLADLGTGPLAVVDEAL